MTATATTITGPHPEARTMSKWPQTVLLCAGVYFAGLACGLFWVGKRPPIVTESPIPHEEAQAGLLDEIFGEAATEHPGANGELLVTGVRSDLVEGDDRKELKPYILWVRGKMTMLAEAVDGKPRQVRVEMTVNGQRVLLVFNHPI